MDKSVNNPPRAHGLDNIIQLKYYSVCIYIYYFSQYTYFTPINLLPRVHSAHQTPLFISVLHCITLVPSDNSALYHTALYSAHFDRGDALPSVLQ